MTDLSALFRHKTHSPSQTITNTHNRHSLPTFTQHPNPPTTHAQFINTPPPPPKVRAVDNDLAISRDVRKTLSLFSMHEEVAWFRTQNLLEWFIKVLLVGALSVGTYWAELASFNVALSLFIWGFLFLGLHHSNCPNTQTSSAHRPSEYGCTSASSERAWCSPICFFWLSSPKSSPICPSPFRQPPPNRSSLRSTLV